MKPFMLRVAFTSMAVGAALALAAPTRAQDSTDAAPQERETKKSQEQTVESRRQALQLLIDAEAALEAGQHARAIALAREAQRLYPESKAVAGFLSAVEPAPAAIKATTTTHNRAKAHLAAALTRAQVLMQQRRYTESIDLLSGIVEAAQKFPATTDVSLYRDLAQKELIEYRIGVQTGKIRPSNETTAPADVSPGAAPVPPLPSASGTSIVVAPSHDFPAAPSNAFRLAKMARDQAPAWYTRIKSGLRKTMSVDYRAMPLGLVLDDIHQATGVTIIIDTPVQAARTPINALVDLRVGTVPAESVLELATQVAGCEYVFLEKGVVITTTDKAGDYIRQLPDAVSNHWAKARYLFPDLYLEAMNTRPLPEAKPSPTQDDSSGPVPAYLRSGRDLIADIEQLIR